MKTLKEQVEEIKSAKGSLVEKRAALVKLGINDYEVRLVMGELRKAQEENRQARYTFGVEIECLCPASDIRTNAEANGLAIRYEGYNHADNRSYFKFVSDASIRGENPIECVSPVLQGKQGLEDLKKCCKTLNDADARVNRSTGLHVHIGAEKMSDKQYVNIFKNYQLLEPAIDSFMARSRRQSENCFCKSLININYEYCYSKDDVLRAVGGNRYYKVNAASYIRHKTVEFRQHQGTTDFEKISAWINFLAKLVTFSKSHVLQETITRIEDIPFLSASEKTFFINRREVLA
jgi:hypothetical protein